MPSLSAEARPMKWSLGHVTGPAWAPCASAWDDITSAAGMDFVDYQFRLLVATKVGCHITKKKPCEVAGFDPAHTRPVTGAGFPLDGRPTLPSRGPLVS